MSGVDDQKQRHRCICALGVRAANKNGACKKFACYQSTILTMEKRLSIERCGGRNPSLTWSIWTKSSQRRRKRWRRRRWRLPKWERSAQTSTRDVKSENIHDGWEKAAIWKKRAMSDEMSSNSCHLKVPKEKAMISRDFNGTPKVKALAQDFAKKKFE